MRILHVGWGYSPLFNGGVTVYVEDLMRALAERGHEQHYFCCGRSDWRLAPYIRRWARNGVEMYELRNPPARITPFVGTQHPELDIEHARVRRLFRKVLESVRPDVVHIQELLGLPARIVDDVKASGIRLVMTLEDFHCLCPTQLLFRLEQLENCADYEDGSGCAQCCRRSPSEAGWRRVKGAAWHTAEPLRRHAPRFYEHVRRAGHAVAGRLRALRQVHGDNNASRAVPALTAAAFRFRREEFVRLLSQADVLHALSSIICGLHQQAGVPADRMVCVGTTVAAISDIRPTRRRPGRPLVFGFRGAFSPGKGAEVLLDAFQEISPQDAILRIHGDVSDSLRPRLADAEAAGQVRHCGRYSRPQLQPILEDTDVGIIPSVWRETYGLVGIEFLAAYIPVIASNTGGVVDYVEDGRNGFLVPPRNARALQAAIERFVADPGLILRMRENMAPIKTMAQHVAEVESFYAPS